MYGDQGNMEDKIADFDDRETRQVDDSSDCFSSETNESFNTKRSELRAASGVDSKNFVRRSLQTCPPQHNEEMLEGLIHQCRKNRTKLQVLEGLLFVLRQLIAPVGNSGIDKAWGYLAFDDAHGMFNSFMSREVDKDEFCRSSATP